jgi:fucose permease
VLGQLVFGLASFVSPLVYSYMAVSRGLSWIAVYWVFAAIATAMMVLTALVRIPRVERTADEKVGALATHRQLLSRPLVWLYFAGVFSYVGLEQGLANWISQFLASQHGIDPQVGGARAVSGFWGLMTVGCVVGLLLLKLMDSRKVLIGFSVLALVTVSCAVFGPSAIAIYAFPLCGFALSVMWSIVVSLALNSLPSHHGTFSGILCTGIVGGALVPLLIGGVGDLVGLRGGLCLVYVPLLYILGIGVWARPLVVNQTFRAEAA